VTRVGIISDVHHSVQPRPGLAYHNPYDVAGALGRLRASLEWFTQEQVDAVILDGDLSDLGDRASLAGVVEAVAEGWSGPALAVPGNHDVGDRHDALARAVREVGRGRVEMASPLAGSHGGLRIAGVEGLDGAGRLPGEGWGDGLIVLASHFPLVSRADVVQRNGFKYAGDLAGREALLAGVLGHPRTVVVNGHLHVRDSHAEGGLLQLSVAAQVEPPFEATILDIDADPAGPTVRRRAARMGRSTVEGEPVLAPPDETWVLEGERWLRAAPHR
jgi:predicted phosphodiesterase